MPLISYPVTAALLLLAAPSSLAHTENEEASCEGNTCPASLLQKVLRNDGKTTVTLSQEQSQPEGCTGVSAQGRCWYLSELGESCKATCKAVGFGFSYVIADQNEPVTPRLVGHIPKTKQEPWAALECYAPDEDRYHTANPNAAKHFNDDIGDWSHENCKLACPCGGPAPEANPKKCDWVQPPACAPKFTYKGLLYTGCATVDSEHNKPWCQHHYQHSEDRRRRRKDDSEEPQDWSFCEYKCDNDPTPEPEGCVWTPAYSCVREFDYEGAHYIGCTTTDHTTPWCSNTAIYEGSWNHCTNSCSGDPDKPPVAPDETLCTWQQPGEECYSIFSYKGVQYTGCIDIDHPTPWCSHDPVHKGSWTECVRVCSKPTGDVTPAPPLPPVPTTAPEETPCTRHPEAENDVIGNTVSLDEAGYKIAASADSPINMKRFVCRVASKIDCEVTDLAALMAFVPYYSGLMSHQTYAHLESELETFCHAGGKWLRPITRQ